MTIHWKARWGMLFLMLTLATGGAWAAASGSSAASAALHDATHSRQTLPMTLRPTFYKALAQDAGAGYRINKAGCAVLPKPALKACFDVDGAHFSGAAPLALHLAAFGRGHNLVGIVSVHPKIKGIEASYRYGSLTAWWRVLPVGFEQGFTIARRPAGAGKLNLILSVTRHSRVSGNPIMGTVPTVHQDAKSNWIPASAGMTKKKVGNTLALGKLRYGKLVVTDANGGIVPARLTNEGNHILISVNDARATYPLTVDPLVWIEQKVTANDGAADDDLGDSVAFSGTTALIGAPLAGSAGMAYVFDESNGTWTQVAKLAPNEGEAVVDFGESVALSGTTALVGAVGSTANVIRFQGAVYVFSESNGIWTQSQKLTANDGGAFDGFGESVVLSGTTALIGADGATVNSKSGEGAAYVFGESNGVWMQQAKLTAIDDAARGDFGFSVALSGTAALVGAPGATVNGNDSQGAAYVFAESNGAWAQQAKLTARDGAAFDGFGQSVALSGTTALVGAPGADLNGIPGQGAAYAFGESNGAWTQQVKLTASDGAVGDFFGASVALSGTTALIGSFSSFTAQGAVYVFSESDGTWKQQAKLAASDGGTSDLFGASVAFSGKIALVGAPCIPFDPTTGKCGPGAAYFYAASDLGLAVSAPQTVAPGQQYASQAIVTNGSSAASQAVSATMAVPAAASFISATATQGGCSEAAGVVTCDFGAINGNAGTATANVTLKAAGTVGDAIHNTVNIVHAAPPLTASAATQIVANQPPVASDGALTTTEGIAASGMLQATDSDGDALTFSIVSQPAHGSVAINDTSKGTYTYTPANGYSGSDSFTFKANDGVADSNTATISITVNAALPPPPPPPNNGGGGGGFGLFALLGLLGLALVGLGLRLRHG